MLSPVDVFVKGQIFQRMFLYAYSQVPVPVPLSAVVANVCSHWTKQRRGKAAPVCHFVQRA